MTSGGVVSNTTPGLVAVATAAEQETSHTCPVITQLQQAKKRKKRKKNFHAPKPDPLTADMTTR